MEFAENTMNELLGWYGFDGADRLDLAAKASTSASQIVQTTAASTVIVTTTATAMAAAIATATATLATTTLTENMNNTSEDSTIPNCTGLTNISATTAIRNITESLLNHNTVIRNVNNDVIVGASAGAGADGGTDCGGIGGRDDAISSINSDGIETSLSQQAEFFQKRRDRITRVSNFLQQHQQLQQDHQQRQENDYMYSFNKELQQNYYHPHNNHLNNNINGNNINKNSTTSTNSSKKPKIALTQSLTNREKYQYQQQKTRQGQNYHYQDSTISDLDTHTSRVDDVADDSNSPNTSGGNNNNKTPITIITTTNTTHPIQQNSMNLTEVKIDVRNCCWCHRLVSANAPEYLTTTDGPRYCSESCFTQSRRASFKKAKTCDWCKCTRHAVSYVDFQDGASQLQFCSDKCLNQYKMQIFCKETQAHLDMNPHLKEQGLEAANNGAGLITPDLWLKNCRSRSASPTLSASLSPSPKALETQQSILIDSLSPQCSVTTSIMPTSGMMKSTTYKPLISVAPVAKLMLTKNPNAMSTSPTSGTYMTLTKHNRKKRPVKVSCVTTINEVNSAKTNCSTSVSPNSQMNANILLSKSHLGTSPRDTHHLLSNQSQTASSLTQFATSSIQDLHMKVSPLSSMLDSPRTTHNIQSFTPRIRGAKYFNTSSVPTKLEETGFPRLPQPPLPLPPPYSTKPVVAMPRFLPRFPHLPTIPPLPEPLLMSPDMPAFIGKPPPITVMVPYPVIIPLPLPIPIPLPVVDFYKAHLTPQERKKFEGQKSTNHKDNLKQVTPNRENLTVNGNEEEEMERSVIVEQPLDCTKARDFYRLKDEPESIFAIEQTHNHVEMKAEDDNIMSDITKKVEDENIKQRQQSEVESFAPTEHMEEVNKRLPKFKLARLQNRRPLLHTKESECSRPLRKRKRIIDYDFQKIHLKEFNQSENLNNPDYALQSKKQF